MGHPIPATRATVTQITRSPHTLRSEENDKPPDDSGRPNEAADMKQEK